MGCHRAPLEPPALVIGGNMATVLAILAERRGDVTLLHQSRCCPAPGRLRRPAA